MAEKGLDAGDIAAGGFIAAALLGLGYVYLTAKTCPNCGAKNALHRRTCWNCNHSLE